MLEAVVLLVVVALFGFGFGTRSYIGALVPGTVLVLAVIVYQRSTPTGDEVDVQPAIWVVASGVGVLVYLAGVALARRSRRTPSDSS